LLLEENDAAKSDVNRYSVSHGQGVVRYAPAPGTLSPRYPGVMVPVVVLGADFLPPEYHSAGTLGLRFLHALHYGDLPAQPVDDQVHHNSEPYRTNDGDDRSKQMVVLEPLPKEQAYPD
jgi:hypothetical protein